MNNEILSDLPDRSAKESLSYLRSMLASEITEHQSVQLDCSLLLQKTRLRYVYGNLTIRDHLLLAGCQRFRGFRSCKLEVGGNLWIGGSSPEHFWLGNTKNLNTDYGNRVAQFLSTPSRESECPFDDWPDSVEVGGNVVLVNCQQCHQLPKSFRFGGDVELINSGINELPDNLTIKGNLKLVRCPIQRLPANLRVEGSLHLGNLPIEALPESLSVGGTLKITDCPNLTEVNDGCSVGNSLRIIRSGVRSIHANVNLREQLLLKSCPIETLAVPKCVDLSVVNCGALSKIELKHLPRTFDAFQVFRCKSLESLPNGIAVRHFCRLRDLPKLRRLPDDFQSEAPIEIAGTELESLSKQHMEELRFRYRFVPIPAYALFDPSRITIEEVLSQDNAEVRRMMLQQMGIERFESKVKRMVVDKDVDPGGERKLIRFSRRSYLLCRCPSTSRTYLLGVPATISNCHAAAAWLAGFNNPDDYRPLIET